MPENEYRRDLTVRSYAVGMDTLREEDDGELSVASIMATENPTLVFDMLRWEPIMEVLLMAGAQIPKSGAVVLLDSHMRTTVQNVLGSTREIKVSGKRLMGRNFISSAEPEVQTKIREKHITDNSIAYVPQKYTDISPGESKEVNGRAYKAGSILLRVTTKWEVRENSLVPIGADKFAKVRGDFMPPEIKEVDMGDMRITEDAPEAREAKTPEVKPEAPAAPAPTTTTEPTPPVVEVREVDARQTAIFAITPTGFEDIAKRAIIEDKTVEEAKVMLREELAKRAKPVGTPTPEEIESTKGGETKDEKKFSEIPKEDARRAICGL
jgi:hypothetical protein